MAQLKSILIILIMGLLPFTSGARDKGTVDFNYPQDVSKNALADLDKALKIGDGRLVVDAIVRYSIAQSVISQDNMSEIVNRIDGTLLQEQRPEYQALLRYFEACAFAAYHESHYMWDRENPEEAGDPADFSTWDATQFSQKINALIRQALSQPDELKRHPITEFEGIITYDQQGALLVPTLYQFLCQKCLELTQDDALRGEIKAAWRQSAKGNVPAYIYACLQSDDDAEKLYEQFKDNEHSGLALRKTYGDRLYATYRDYVSRFPNSIYAPDIKNKITTLEAREVNLTYPEVLHSSDSVAVTINSRNVNYMKVTVYRVPDRLVKYDDQYSEIPFGQLVKVQTQALSEQGTIPFYADRRTIHFAPLPYGQYVIVPDYEVDDAKHEMTEVYRHQFLTVTDIALFWTAEVEGKNRIFAVDQKSGAPLAGVNILGRHQGVTDGDGSLVIPDKTMRSEFRATKGDDHYGPDINYYKTQRGDNSDVTAQVFTDLAIYRPGETVKVATILYYQDDQSRIIKANEPIQIRLMDTNYQDIDTISGTTDAYGRFEGEFTLPTDRMNGQFQMVVEYGKDNDRAAGHHINVSEYKTPTFVVTYLNAKTGYTRRQPVKIAGKAETYSGMPVANAEVKLTLRKQEWSWWWRHYSTSAQGEVIWHDTVTTDAQGQFSVELADSLFDESEARCLWARNNYSLQAQVTDGAGETQEDTHTFIVGTRRGISLPDAMIHEGNDAITLPLQYNNTDENATAVACTWKLVDADSKQVVATGNLMSDHPVIDLSKVPSGQYKLKVHILDADDEEEDADAETDITLYRKTDGQTPVKDTTLWLHRSQNRVDQKNKGHILVGTSAPEAHIYYIASDRKGVRSQGWLHYCPGLHDLVLDVPTDRENYLDVMLLSYHNGTQSSQTVRLVAPAATDSLHLRVTTFRDRLVPGRTERWTFRIVDKDESRRQGALLLAMTDKAINDISDNTWQFAVPMRSPSWYHLNAMRFSGNNYTSLDWQGKIISTKDWSIPELYTYDQELFGYMGRGRVMYKAMRMPAGAVFEEMAMAEEADMMYDSDDNNVTRALEGRAAGVVSELAIAEVAVTTTDKKRLDGIKLREADVKTALWMPMLTSDADGNVAVEFEAPEFNTTWVLQAIGYDKQLYTDRLEREVVTQKPIMVKPSLPRFVRQGDRVTLSANVQNATDHATAVDAVIELFNPRTGEVYTSQDYQHTLDAHGTQAVSISWDVPEQAAFVGFRIKAANDEFGDGEQVMLPVLQAMQPVIETQPFYIEAAAPQFTLQVPSSARNARVTLEYCDNPVWYCVTALPTIYDEHCVTASSLAHTLFAIEVAQGVAAAQPQVRDAINYWKTNAQDSTLVSMLARNQDLKIGTLLASPWVREADHQTLRMSRLDELMDAAKMDKERTRIVTLLSDLQMSDGGFTWLRHPGCRSSYYTTSEVLELVGEIQHLGYLKDNTEVDRMMQRALAYYDKETLRQYKDQNNKKDYSAFSTFVYTRSLFPTVKMSREVQSLFNNALKQMSKDWSKGLSLGEKAFFALALNRNGYQKTARDITESIRQFAITKPALGTYWDNLQVGWRYFDKVAVTSTILQALNECDPRQQEIDNVRKWMLLMKQTNDWGSSSLAADAVYSLLSTGSQWLAQGTPARITIGGTPLQLDKVDEYLGYLRKTIDVQPGDEISIERNASGPAWGAVYCQFSALMTDIPAVAIDELSVTKDYSIVGTDGKLTPATTLHVGDRVRVRTIIKCNRDLDFVTLVDERAACFEPVDKLSGYRTADRTWYYHETKDAHTRLFFSDLQKGTHVITYDVHVTAAGTFSAGIATIQCQYAPQMTVHSAGQRLTVE